MAISKREGMPKIGQQQSPGLDSQHHHLLCTQSVGINKGKQTQFSFPGVQKAPQHRTETPVSFHGGPVAHRERASLGLKSTEDQDST